MLQISQEKIPNRKSWPGQVLDPVPSIDIWTELHSFQTNITNSHGLAGCWPASFFFFSAYVLLFSASTSEEFRINTWCIQGCCAP